MKKLLEKKELKNLDSSILWKRLKPHQIVTMKTSSASGIGAYDTLILKNSIQFHCYKIFSLEIIKTLTVHGLVDSKARLDYQQLARPGAGNLSSQKLLISSNFLCGICETLTHGKATKVSMDFQLIAESDESKSFKKKPKLKNVTLQKISANLTNRGKAAAKASLDSRQSAEPDMSSCQKYENFSFGNLMSNDNALGKASLEFRQSAESDKSNLSKLKPSEDLESNIFENVTNRCKATFTKVGVEFRPIAEQNDSNSHKTLNSKSHLHSKSNFPLKIKTSELDEADLEFQSNASSILTNFLKTLIL